MGNQRPPAGPMGSGPKMARRGTPIQLPISDGRIVGSRHGHAYPRQRTAQPVISSNYSKAAIYLSSLLPGGAWHRRRCCCRTQSHRAALTELAAAARAIGAGDLRQQVPLRGSEEVAAVAGAI
ncbi:MAG: hypothetical protein R2932_28525 [Caldilineaceae bacterium]